MASKRRLGRRGRGTPAWNMTSVFSIAVGQSLNLAFLFSNLANYKSFTNNPLQLIMVSQNFSKIFQGLFKSRNSKQKNRNDVSGYKFFNHYMKRVPRVNFISENVVTNMDFIRKQSPDIDEDKTETDEDQTETDEDQTETDEDQTIHDVYHSDDQLTNRENLNSDTPNSSTCIIATRELEKTKKDNPRKFDIEPEVYKYQQKLNRFDFLKQQLLRHPNETYLSKFLGKLRIKHKISVYREKKFRLDSPEIFCKNLLLKDRKGKFYYLICAEDKAMNLKLACKLLGAYRNLSFASETETTSILHVQKGGITPFALMHETAAHVTVAITTDLVEDVERLMNFHPFESNLTLSLTLESLQIYLKVFDHSLKFLSM